VLDEELFDMTGSGLAPLIIPIAGTLCLSAWLALVFYCDRRPHWARGQLAPGRDDPGRGHVIQVPGAAGPQGDLLAVSVEAADLRVISEVER
jgi:hypothetical protein